MSDRRPMIAGNWKMHLNLDEASQLVKAVAAGVADAKGVDVLVAPPFTSLGVVRAAIGESGMLLGAQNMHWESQGAFTGEIAPEMLLGAGCTHVILGHSERRSLFGETSDMIERKARAAVQAGLVPIVCIGETLEERESGKTFDLIQTQLDESLKGFRDGKSLPLSTVLAYEPVWAIGTGETATPEQAQEVHHFIRDWLKNNFNEETADSVRVLYGGSVKPDNVKDLMSKQDIDGALVGGASLNVDSFVAIVKFEEN